MRIYLDTETTDYWNFGRPPTDESQPAPAQVAALLEDDQGRALGTLSAMMTWSRAHQITARAERVHGISQEMIDRYGHPPIMVWHHLVRMMEHATLVVGHNIEFDMGVLDRWADLVAMPRIVAPPTFCTMRESTAIVRIPKAGGRAGWKWPNLGEAYYHFERKKLTGAHDALADVYGARAVYRGIQRHASSAADRDDRQVDPAPVAE